MRGIALQPALRLVPFQVHWHMLIRARIAALEIVDILSRCCSGDRHIQRWVRPGRQQRVEALHQIGAIDVQISQVGEDAVLLTSWITLPWK